MDLNGNRLDSVKPAGYDCLMSVQQTIIFTDLDGTLLDHETYGYEPALAAVEQIREKAIPLIFNSSKTAAEMMHLQQGLKIDEPFIAENGAGAYIRGEDGDWFCRDFATHRDEILEVLRKLREEGFAFEGFHDWGPAGIAEKTGLPPDDATRAGQREFSEPLLLAEPERDMEPFLAALAEHGLTAAQGGRFLTVTGPCDKAQSMDWMTRALFPDTRPRVIALGDSPNDAEMLNAADVAVVVLSDRSESLQISGPATTIRTQKRGPGGWADALLPILADLDPHQNETGL